MRVLLTGVAGFIGAHLARALLDRGDEVVGLDSLNDYYDVRLKQDRLEQLIGEHPAFRFERLDLADRGAVERVFVEAQPTRVVHLAAQAGVRYSVKNPYAYLESNLVAFLHILEGCRHHAVEHLVYASSSSVYGANSRLPFSVHDPVDHPVSLYAATKRANELMAHSYSHLYRLPTTGLRFFTVYGPWGRPDMAVALFAKAILEGRPIDIYNYGHMRRDFTYVDDIVTGVLRVTDRTATPEPTWSSEQPDPATSSAPFRLYNIGNHQPVELMYLIELIERGLGRQAKKNLLPLAPGDVLETYADVTELATDVDFRPNTPIETGIARYLEWYRKYYGVT